MDQIDRLITMCSLACGTRGEVEDFLAARLIARPLSSIEAEVFARLTAFFPCANSQVYTRESMASIDSSRPPDDDLDPMSTQEAVVLTANREQRRVQSSFFRGTDHLLDDRSRYFAMVNSLNRECQINGHRVFVAEQYLYSSSSNYRSTFFHLIRNLTNVTGDESSSELEANVRAVLDGKEILEIGCGPGFFLAALKRLGANVLGIDCNEDCAGRLEELRGCLLICNAVEGLRTLGRRFDIVLSRNFLSLNSTYSMGREIIDATRDVLKPGGLSIHSLDTSVYTQDEYYEDLVDLFGEDFGKVARTRRDFSTLVSSLPGVEISRNIPNVAHEDFLRCGYKVAFSLANDVDDFTTFIAWK
jgi:SAM-dependent methyltransferase